MVRVLAVTERFFSVHIFSNNFFCFENGRAPKRGRNANFQKSLKTPCNGVIKTLCAKNQVCKSICVTCSTYR